jgi:two-component system sensor histidine kinase KdpD
MPTMQVMKGTYRRSVAGGILALAAQAVVMLCMLPFRSHLSIATPALVFVVPVVVGVVIGGFASGSVAALGGFLFYDIFFLPPYGTLTVRAPQNWTALVVYALVVLVVARVVTNLQKAREESHRREEDAARLYELSQALIGDLTLAQLLQHIAATVQAVFSPRWTVMLVPGETDGRGDTAALAVAAQAGQVLTSEETASLTDHSRQIRSLGLSADPSSRVAVALVARNRPIGMLVLQEVQFARQDRALLGTFANQAALAVERAQLQDQALRAMLLEEVDRWRGAMMGAVSHDLRTPLASIKTAVSSLRQSGGALPPQDSAELLELIELQSDRLARLVTNLLDMTRIESGALEVRAAVVSFDELVAEALTAVEGLVAPSRVVVNAPADLPLLSIDHVLIGQVLANLLENAGRIAPDGSPISVDARVNGDAVVEVSVTDEGPGIASSEQQRVFHMFSRNSGGGRAGLGLAIAKAFVEAHGGIIWIDPSIPRGARVAFTLPVAAAIPSHV